MRHLGDENSEPAEEQHALGVTLHLPRSMGLANWGIKK